MLYRKVQERFQKQQPTFSNISNGINQQRQYALFRQSLIGFIFCSKTPVKQCDRPTNRRFLLLTITTHKKEFFQGENT